MLIIWNYCWNDGILVPTLLLNIYIKLVKRH